MDVLVVSARSSGKVRESFSRRATLCKFLTNACRLNSFAQFGGDAWLPEPHLRAVLLSVCQDKLSLMSVRFVFESSVNAGNSRIEKSADYFEFAMSWYHLGVSHDYCRWLVSSLPVSKASVPSEIGAPKRAEPVTQPNSVYELNGRPIVICSRY